MHGGTEEILTGYAMGRVQRYRAMELLGINDYGTLRQLLNAMRLSTPVLSELTRIKLNQNFDLFFEKASA